MRNKKLINNAENHLVVGSLEVLGDISGGTMQTVKRKVNSLNSNFGVLSAKTKDYWSALSNDSIITPVEKIVLKQEWDCINGTYTALRQEAISKQVQDTSTIIAYFNAYNQLSTYLFTTLQLFDEMSMETEIPNRQLFNSYFSTYYATENLVQTALISGVIDQLEFFTTVDNLDFEGRENQLVIYAGEIYQWYNNTWKKIGTNGYCGSLNTLPTEIDGNYFLCSADFTAEVFLVSPANEKLVSPEGDYLLGPVRFEQAFIYEFVNNTWKKVSDDTDYRYIVAFSDYYNLTGKMPAVWQNTIDELLESIDDLDTAQTAQSNLVETYKSQILGELDATAADLRSSITSTNTTLQTLRDEYDITDGDFQQLLLDYEATDDELDALAEQYNLTAEDHDKLKTEFGYINDEFVALRNSVANTNTVIQNIRTSYNISNEDYQNIIKDFHIDSAELTALKTKYSITNADFESLQQAVTVVNGKFRLILTDLGFLQTSLATAQQTIQSLTTQYEGLDAALDEILEDNLITANEISDLKDKYDLSDDEIEALQTALNGITSRVTAVESGKVDSSTYSDAISGINSTLAGKVDTSTYNSYVSNTATALQNLVSSGAATEAEVQAMLNNMTPAEFASLISTYGSSITAIQTALANKIEHIPEYLGTFSSIAELNSYASTIKDGDWLLCITDIWTGSGRNARLLYIRFNIYVYSTTSGLTRLNPEDLHNSSYYMSCLPDIMTEDTAETAGAFGLLFAQAFFASTAVLESLKTTTLVIDAGGSISSENFTSGEDGFYIDGATGVAEFNNVTARGTFESDAVYLGTQNLSWKETIMNTINQQKSEQLFGEQFTTYSYTKAQLIQILINNGYLPSLYSDSSANIDITIKNRKIKSFTVENWVDPARPVYAPGGIYKYAHFIFTDTNDETFNIYVTDNYDPNYHQYTDYYYYLPDLIIEKVITNASILKIKNIPSDAPVESGIIWTNGTDGILRIS